MSSYDTSSPQTWQVRLYRMRPPSVRCTWWKRMSFSSVAEKSLTAIDTRPNETAPFQIARISSPTRRERAPRSRMASLRRLRKVFAGAYGDQVPGAPLSPMLATAGTLPHGPGWSYEFKWDGVRVLSSFGHGPPRLWARSGAAVTLAYPEVAALSLPAGSL